MAAVVEKTQASSWFDDDSSQEQPVVPTPLPKPTVDPGKLARLRGLIDEVTEELMKSPGNDRAVCREDAITLLFEAALEGDGEQAQESPLMYLLAEERQKAGAVVGKADGGGGQTLTFFKV